MPALLLAMPWSIHACMACLPSSSTLMPSGWMCAPESIMDFQTRSMKPLAMHCLLAWNMLTAINSKSARTHASSKYERTLGSKVPQKQQRKLGKQRPTTTWLIIIIIIIIIINIYKNKTKRDKGEVVMSCYELLWAVMSCYELLFIIIVYYYSS